MTLMRCCSTAFCRSNSSTWVFSCSRRAFSPICFWMCACTSSDLPIHGMPVVVENAERENSSAASEKDHLQRGFQRHRLALRLGSSPAE